MRKLLMRGGMSPLDNMVAENIIQQNSINRNAGNSLYLYGLYRTLLTEDTIIDMDYYNITKDDYTDDEIARINQEYDAYVCPMSSAFRNAFTLGLVRVAKLLDKLTIPCYVVGICLQAPYEPSIGSPRRFDDAARQFVKAVLNKSEIIGVRGEITGDYLKYLGFKEERDYTVIGCPSLFTQGYVLPKPHIMRFSKDSHVSFNYHVGTSGNVIEFLFREMEKYPNHYVVAQNLEELKLLYYGQSLPKRYYHKSDLPPQNIFTSLLMEDRYRLFINVPTWVDFLGGMDLSIGGRFHGNVAAVLAGCPIISIPTDSRVRELVSYHKLPSVPYTEIDENTRIEELVECVDLCSHLAGHKANFNHFLDFLDKNHLDHIYKNDRERRDAPLDVKTSKISYHKVESILQSASQDLPTRIEQLNKEVKKDKADQRKILKSYLKQMDASLFKSFQTILLYGAGVQGKTCLKLFRNLGIEVSGFVISDGQPWIENVSGIPVYTYSKLPFNHEQVLIIQTASSPEIEQTLRQSEFHWMKFPNAFWKTIKN